MIQTDWVHSTEGMMDLCYWMLYDRLRVPSNTVSLSQYEVLKGAVGIDGKFYDSTNMEMPNKLPAPCQFLIKGFSVFRSPTSNKDMYDKFITNYGLDLWLGMKSYFRAPGAMFSSEHEINSFLELIKSGEYTKHLEEDEGVIIPIRGAVELLKGYELVIPQGMYFSLKLNSLAGVLITDPLDIYAAMWGIMARGVM